MLNTASSSRHMWTLKNGTMTRFNTTNITDADLGTGTSTTTCAAAGDCITGCTCGNVVGFYQGNTTASPSDNLEQWKLGDLYHTNPVLVQTPNQYFFDPRECTLHQVHHLTLRSTQAISDRRLPAISLFLPAAMTVNCMPSLRAAVRIQPQAETRYGVSFHRTYCRR